MKIPSAPIEILQRSLKDKVPINPYNTKFIKEALKNRQPSKNPYESKIPSSTSFDTPLVRDAGYNLLGNSLGNPVYTALTIMSGSYTDNGGRVITFPRIDFESVLISVSFPRVIIKTEIQGRDGTVKEYIGEGDAQLSIAGIICGLNGHYPIDEVNQLKQVIKAPIAIDVVSAYLQNLDIYSIVFEDREIGQDSGGYSYQRFVLSAISDIPQELRIEGV
jgi:hypothetical protein